MQNRVQSLALNKFRGATTPLEIEFDVKKPISMIFGENGTGKSTIVDGIDFVCNEQFGSLDDHSVSSKKSKLIASLNESEKKIEVSLKYNNQTWKSIIGNGNRPESKGPNNRPISRILRRSQILKIIDSKPSDRYRELKSFIEVPYCQKNEDSLIDAFKESKKKYDEATRDKQSAEDSLIQLWEKENKPGQDYKVWAKEKLKEGHDILKSNSDKIEKLLKLYVICGSMYNGFLDSKKSLKEIEKLKDDAKDAFLNNQLDAVDMSSVFIDVLKTARLYFQKNSKTQNCPVCESEINVRNVIERIDKRMVSMKEQVKLKDDYESAQKQVENKQDQLQVSEKKFIDNVKVLLKYFYEENIFNIIRPVSKESLPFWEKFSIEEFNTLTIDPAVAICKEIKSHKEELEKNKEAMDKTFYQLNPIHNHINLIEENDILCNTLEKQVKRLQDLLEILDQERKSYVESILADVSERVHVLFSKIHPDEGYGKINFYLKPNVRGSIEYTGQFQNVDNVIPQAYFSESHLDTLGICVFLALAKYYSNEDTIIVMDDVVTSVDQVHMERFSKMILEEASHFNQFIITTHYRAWRDRYKYAQGPSSNIQLIELLPWSLGRGIRHTKTKLIVDDLTEKCIEEIFDRQVVASESGILLEGLLDFLTKQYECRLPRKPAPFYTLGELLSGLNNKLRKSLKIEKFKDDETINNISLSSLISSIEEKTWIRNQVGAHFNILGNDICDQDVRQFGKNTIELANALICEWCGQLPDSRKSGCYCECRCGKIRLHPQTMPN